MIGKTFIDKPDCFLKTRTGNLYPNPAACSADNKQSLRHPFANQERWDSFFFQRITDYDRLSVIAKHGRRDQLVVHGRVLYEKKDYSNYLIAEESDNTGASSMSVLVNRDGDSVERDDFLEQNHGTGIH